MNRFRTPLLLLRRYRLALYTGFACIVVTQLAQVATVVLARTAVNHIQSPGAPVDLFGPLQAAYEVLAGLAGGDANPVRVIAVLIVVIALLRGLTQFLMRWLIVGSSRRLEHDLRERIFAHLERLHFGWFDRARTGDILSRVTADVEAVRMPIGPGVMYLVNTLVVAPVAFGIMWTVSSRLTLLVLAPMLLVAVVTRFLAPHMHRAGVDVQESQAELSTRAQESFSGARVVKTYGREAEESRQFEDAGRRYVGHVLRFAKLRSLMGPSFSILGGLGMLAILWFGAREVADGSMTIGDLLLFYLFNGILMWPMIALGWVIALFQRGAAAMERIQEILDTEPAILDAPGAVPLPAPRGDLEVRDLTFAYADGEPVLRDLSFRVPAGGSLGIIGPTGSGKSTLLSLVPRLFRVPPGTVFVDGHDVNDVRVADLRRAIASVPQETFLFSTTIGGNIAYGFDGEPPDGVVERAAEASRIAPEIERLPDRYDTLLGERGVNLSGGQKQRTAIARALALDPPVLLLDDCLSAVDASTEEEILRNLREAIRGRTTLIVSHRVAAVSTCERVAFLEEGRIVEIGTHEELLARGGRYAHLADIQTLEAAIEEVD